MRNQLELNSARQEIHPTHPPKQRRHQRYPIRLPLLHKSDGAGTDRAEIGWTHNVSEGGVCVELSERLQSQRPTRVRLQTAQGAIEVEAKVVWSREAGSTGGGILHGMAFTQLAPEHLESIRELFRAKGPVRHAGVRWPLDVPVTCRPKNQEKRSIHGRTGEIGRGGLLLRLHEMLPPGTRLEITLHAPREPLTVFGVVAWVRSPENHIPGEPISHGVRFTSLGPSLSMALGSLLAKPL
jgi:c-di-GMP-binding flagellar brake protein YcgR